MATEFVVPEFLENRSIQEVHDEMLSSLPDLDCSEGQHVYNFAEPTVKVAVAMNTFEKNTVEVQKYG